MIFESDNEGGCKEKIENKYSWDVKINEIIEVME